jgi:hypothetical protein
MRGSGRRRKHDAAEDVGSQLLLSFGLLESLLPVGGGELEQAIGGPGWEQAEQVPEVAVRLDVVESSAGEERNEYGVDGGAVIAADEKPVSTTEDLAAQIQLADVVVCGQTAVIEETAQSERSIADSPRKEKEKISRSARTSCAFCTGTATVMCSRRNAWRRAIFASLGRVKKGT